MIFFKREKSAFDREGYPTIPLPTRNLDAAAFDMRSTIRIEIHPRAKVSIPLGFSMQVPPSTCGLLLPRSGLGAKHNIILANTVGLIDPDYRGELTAILYNRSSKNPYLVEIGDRVCQLAIVPFCNMVAVEAEELSETTRGNSGFGSSGIE